MSVLIAQIAPQRSTQYAALASALAPQELLLSPVGALVRALEPLCLGGQDYLRAELEADLIRERTVSGLAAARARGKTLGRPAALDSTAKRRAARLQRSGHSIRQIAEQLECGASTVHRALMADGPG